MGRLGDHPGQTGPNHRSEKKTKPSPREEKKGETPQKDPEVDPERPSFSLANFKAEAILLNWPRAEVYRRNRPAWGP